MSPAAQRRTEGAKSLLHSWRPAQLRNVGRLVLCYSSQEDGDLRRVGQLAEQIETYDANLAPMGIRDRAAAHREGMWHKTFHCWIVSRQAGGGLLFSLRSPEMNNHPQLLDTTVAGHLLVGESDCGGVREIREELGIEVRREDLISLGYRVEVEDNMIGQRNREYQAVYLLERPASLHDYRPNVHELSGLFWLRIEDGLRLFNANQPMVTIEGCRYDSKDGRAIPAEWEVTRDCFRPRIQNYYLAVCIMAERLIEGRLPLAIS